MAPFRPSPGRPRPASAHGATRARRPAGGTGTPRRPEFGPRQGRPSVPSPQQAERGPRLRRRESRQRARGARELTKGRRGCGPDGRSPVRAGQATPGPAAGAAGRGGPGPAPLARPARAGATRPDPGGRRLRLPPAPARPSGSFAGAGAGRGNGACLLRPPPRAPHPASRWAARPLPPRALPPGLDARWDGQVAG